MRHLTFAPKIENNYDIVILIKDSYFDKDKIYEHYVKPLVTRGIKAENIIALNLEYPSLKVTAKQAKDYLTKSIIPAIKQVGAKFVYCADSTYFKALTGKVKSEPYLGYMVSTPHIDYVQVSYGINYSILLYNPNQSPKLDLSLNALASAYLGNYKELGENVIQTEYYPFSELQIKESLDLLLEHPALTCDIEAFSLKLHDAGIGTITFAWDEHNGLAFAVDCVALSIDNLNGNIVNKPVRTLLKRFFERYKGKMIYHNATYDVKVLLLNLFMEHPQDYRGMLYGLDVMTRNIEDTKVISFLALNTTADISLSLKDLSHEYTGNYAQTNIHDITQIPMDELLRYNLTDALATWYVYKKYYPQMVQDQQEEIYRSIMIPSLKILIQMELVGMPVNPKTVEEQSKILMDKGIDLLDQIRADPNVKAAVNSIAVKELAVLNAKLKTKQHALSKMNGLVFNPGSPKHMQTLLYEQLGLAVIDTTPTKEPAVGGKTLAKYLSHPLSKPVKNIIQLLMDYGKLIKITSTFIPALQSAVLKQDGRAYLHANFNLNGALSGRMSCNSPNLQQIPSKGDYGKIIKKCFQPPKGWLFGSADFPSLEDRVNALLTRDPNKLKVYIDGFDGHSLRAAKYFDLPVDINDPKSVNTIETDYPDERQDSKAPTFALTYQGTWVTIMKNCGFSEAKSKKIEKEYHSLYSVSDQWLADQLDLCCKQGYITVAFGLRIRTPLLAKSILNTSKTLRESQAEARTVGNAIAGQSYGLLNNRAAIDFMNRVWASEYKYDIFLVSMIHDAIYIIFKDDINVVTWINLNLPDAMAFQDLPEIDHPQVKLRGAKFGIHHPTWAKEVTLPNGATSSEILEICKASVQ